MGFDMQMRLARDTATPWLAVWRRAAAAAEPPPAWHYRIGAPGVDGLLRPPGLDTARYRALSWINEEAAILELEFGGPGAAASAVRRARENVAMAHLLARSPHMREHIAGYALLFDAAKLLRSAGERTGDRAAVRDGQRLLDAAWRLRPVQEWAVTPRSPDADSAIAAALALAGDRRQPPAVRAGSVAELVLAHSCLTPQRMVAGPAGSLDASLGGARSRMADIDPEGRLGPAIQRAGLEWDAMTSGGAWRRQRRDVPGWARVLPALGLGGLTGRAFACAER